MGPALWFNLKITSKTSSPPTGGEDTFFSCFAGDEHVMLNLLRKVFILGTLGILAHFRHFQSLVKGDE